MSAGGGSAGAGVELDERVLQDLYAWLDGIPLSRPKRDIRRDFADGVLVAEVVKHFLPSLVDLHNYPSALAVNKKLVNWHMLNRKVLSKLWCELSDDVITCIVNARPGAAEQFLLLLRSKIEQFLAGGEGVGPRSAPTNQHLEREWPHSAPTNQFQQMAMSDRPEADQDVSGYYVSEPGGYVQYNAQPNYNNNNLANNYNMANNHNMATATEQQMRSRALVNQAGLSRRVNDGNVGAVSNNSGGRGVERLGGEGGVGGGRPAGGVVRKQQQQGGAVNEIIVDEKDETIRDKVKRLEHLVQLKDIRIEDLQTRLYDLEMSVKVNAQPERSAPPLLPARRMR